MEQRHQVSCNPSEVFGIPRYVVSARNAPRGSGVGDEVSAAPSEMATCDRTK